MENIRIKSYLKAKNTKLLKSNCNTIEEFENIQSKLDEVELQLNLVSGDKNN